MALDVAQLKIDIKEATDAAQAVDDPQQAEDIYTTKLAEAIERFVRTGTVQSTPGNVT